MSNLTDVYEDAVINYVTKGTQPPALVAPMRVRLLSALGAGDAAGTPVTVATTPAVPLGAGAAANGATSNTAILRWEGLANPTTVAGFQVIDSAGTPAVVLDNIPRTGGNLVVTSGIFEVPAAGLVNTAA